MRASCATSVASPSLPGNDFSAGSKMCNCHPHSRQHPQLLLVSSPKNQKFFTRMTSMIFSHHFSSILHWPFTGASQDAAQSRWRGRVLQRSARALWPLLNTAKRTALSTGVLFLLGAIYAAGCASSAGFVLVACGIAQCFLLRSTTYDNHGAQRMGRRSESRQSHAFTHTTARARQRQREW